jgi:transcription initiation factor TFIIB
MSKSAPREYGTESLATESTGDESTGDVQLAERPTTCPECGGRVESDAEHAGTVCTDCGLVVDEDRND